MQHVITCANIRCRYNDGYTHCKCKTIGVTITGNCATFVPTVKEQKKIDTSPMGEHANMR